MEMHLEAAIKRVWRYTWRPRSSAFGDAIGSRDRATLEMHLEAVIDRVWTSTGRQSLDGAQGAQTVFTSYNTHNRGNVTR
jgi:hypothetical protein